MHYHPLFPSLRGMPALMLIRLRTYLLTPPWRRVSGRVQNMYGAKRLLRAASGRQVGVKRVGHWKWSENDDILLLLVDHEDTGSTRVRILVVHRGADAAVTGDSHGECPRTQHLRHMVKS